MILKTEQIFLKILLTNIGNKIAKCKLFKGRNKPKIKKKDNAIR
jgi:hypothetical protein